MNASSNHSPTLSAFNSYDDDGRITRVLMNLQHACEMLLKAVLLQEGIKVFDKATGKSIGFERCLGLCVANHQLTMEEAGIAVLCASEDAFDRYLGAAAGQFSGRHLPIVSREPSSELRHAGKRFIFSMPEYVAGRQFDTVFLIHVDAGEAPRDASDGVRRRFISNIYLGSSRAENTLKLASCLTRGGRSDVLDMAIQRNSLVEAAPPSRQKKRKS